MTGTLSMMVGGKVAPALSATASPSTLSWAPSGGYYATSTTTATPSGGTGPYTYLWEQVSGVGGVAFEDQDTTYFNSIVTGASVWRCLVTDANGVSAYTNNVSIS